MSDSLNSIDSTPYLLDTADIQMYIKYLSKVDLMAKGINLESKVQWVQTIAKRAKNYLLIGQS